MMIPVRRVRWLLLPSSALAQIVLAPLLFAAEPSMKIVALLDQKSAVNDADIADWQKAQECYGEGAISSRKAGFMRLLEAAIAEAALRVHGGPSPKPEDLEAEAERIDKDTRAPEILACIKRAFEKDRSRYLKIFVRPVLIETRLRLFLPNDRKVQAKAFAAVEKAQAALKVGASLRDAAEQAGMFFSTSTFSLSASSGPELGFQPGRMPWSPFEADFITENLKNLAPGTLKPDVIESDYDLRLVRLLAVAGEKYTFETASARKAGQEEWFKSLPKMKLLIRDAELKAWILSIKGNPRLAATEVH